MQQTLRGLSPGGLERSCGDSIRVGRGAPGVERVEARFPTLAFAPHRHDTYAIGMTLAGVQAFRYRGAGRISLPGQLHVLHPDELHDGRPATDAGFAYRILHIDPERLRGALGGRALPFVADPVHDPSPATRELVRLLAELDEPVSDLARPELAATVADALVALSGGPAPAAAGPIDLAAMERVREHLAAHAREPTPAAALERVAGLDRFTIARQFRRAFGTSPDRYRTMRRLALARSAIERGEPLARAAADAGFADQSHLTRQFKRAYGVTPGRWARMVAAADRPHGVRSGRG
jgi:AraC-like DNA-binding protein